VDRCAGGEFIDVDAWVGNLYSHDGSPFSVVTP
jgi:hypothetical protein